MSEALVVPPEIIARRRHDAPPSRHSYYPVHYRVKGSDIGWTEYKRRRSAS